MGCFSLNDARMLIGTRIKELRKLSSISQETLANLAGMDRTYVTSVENGKRNISIVNINKICCALDIDLYHFFDSDIFISGKGRHG